MASWIVHLRIAEELLVLIPGLEAEKFALGSVAPDSGKPDEKWENFSPPTTITHFEKKTGRYHDLADLDFFRQYLLSLGSHPDPQVFSLRLGYFFHLITDNLWSNEIGQPTLQKFREKFEGDKDFIWEVKKDWYGLDFIYVRDHPDCLYWRVFCSASPDTGELEFLVPESLAWSVDHIQQYYRRTDAEVQKMYNRPYIYLSKDEVDGFVDKSSGRLFRIYQQLWLKNVKTGKTASVLELEL